MGKPVKVAIIADADSLRREMKLAERSTESFQRQVDTTARKTKTDFDKIDRNAKQASSSVSSSFSGMAAGMATAGAAGLAALGVFSYQAIQTASATEEASNLVAVSFGAWAKDVEDMAARSAEALGISRREFLQAAGSFGALLRSMGLGEEAAAGLSTSLVTLAADLGSFYDASPTDVLDALRSGLVGEAEPLRRFGINISEARAQQEALTLGIWDGVGALDAGQKAQAIYSLILQDSALAQGDFGRTIDSTSNKTKVLAAEFDDLKGQLGEKLLPVANWVLDRMLGGVEAISSWWESDGQDLFVRFQDGWSKLGDGIDVLSGKWDTFSGKFTRGMEKIGGWIDSVKQKWREFQIFVDIFERSIGLWVAENLNLATAISGVIQWAMNLPLSLFQTMGTVAEATSAFVRAILSDLGSKLQWVWDRIVQIRDIAESLANNPLVQALTGASVRQGIGNAIGSALGGALGFDAGGVVPGPRGASRVAVVHGGERIIPEHKNKSDDGPSYANVNVYLDGVQISSTVQPMMRSDRRARAGIGVAA